MAVSDMLLLPHADLHLVLDNPPASLKLALFNRFDDPANPKRFATLPVPLASCEFEFMAPHADVGKRFDNVPSVNKTTGVVTAPAPGVFLFQIRFGHFYQVGRLQVHRRIQSWWFGSTSITTARDLTLGHALPSVYAKFSDDPTGTDLIGDITGHGYVPLTSTSTAKVVIMPNGRLRGVVETAEPRDPANPLDPTDPNRLPAITGTLLGRTRSLPVRVVDYAKARNELEPVQAPTADQADDKHNMVFLAEGFQGLIGGVIFAQAVETAVGDLFDKPRHEPYGLLEDAFNVFRAYLPSVEEGLTTGFRVTDTATKAGPAGLPIPYNGRIGNAPDLYTLEELVFRVGLPMRGESRPDLPGLWFDQKLPDFNINKVNADLVDAWKAHRSVGLLQARDTAFGLILGARPADQPSGASDPLPRPATDDGGPAVTAFIGRVYEFYRTPATRVVTLDPRRHPPELYSPGGSSPGNSIMSYLGGLHHSRPPNQAIGLNWVPDDTRFQPSRGLVGLIGNEPMNGGTNINESTLTAVTVGEARSLPFAYLNRDDPEEMERRPGIIQPDLDKATNTIAHEFGHSFNLGDEYEEFDGDDATDQEVVDLSSDNVARLGFLRNGPAPTRKLRPDLVKWLELPRMQLSERLLAPSSVVPGMANLIRVRIEPLRMGPWVAAARAGTQVHLRSRQLSKSGVQLPLNNDPALYLTGLSIAFFDEQAGTVDLAGAVVPLVPFPAGSVVFVPLRNAAGDVETVTKRAVRAFLDAQQDPLNADLDHLRRNTDTDQALPIPGFVLPAVAPQRVIGVYEGALHFAGGYYRPAGACKMRSSVGIDTNGQFCFVCKWLIVNRVDPSYHDVLSDSFYPDQ